MECVPATNATTRARSLMRRANGGRAEAFAGASSWEGTRSCVGAAAWVSAAVARSQARRMV